MNQYTTFKDKKYQILSSKEAWEAASNRETLYNVYEQFRKQTFIGSSSDGYAQVTDPETQGWNLNHTKFARLVSETKEDSSTYHFRCSELNSRSVDFNRIWCEALQDNSDVQAASVSVGSKTVTLSLKKLNSSSELCYLGMIVFNEEIVPKTTMCTGRYLYVTEGLSPKQVENKLKRLSRKQHRVDVTVHTVNNEGG